jgi:hypothetical protein
VSYSLKRWCWSRECQSHVIDKAGQTNEMAAEKYVYMFFWGSSYFFGHFRVHLTNIVKHNTMRLWLCFAMYTTTPLWWLQHLNGENPFIIIYNRRWNNVFFFNWVRIAYIIEKRTASDQVVMFTLERWHAFCPNDMTYSSRPWKHQLTGVDSIQKNDEQNNEICTLVRNLVWRNVHFHATLSNLSRISVGFVPIADLKHASLLCIISCIALRSNARYYCC